MVAGVLAGLMTDGASPEDAQNQLYTIAYPRKADGRDVLFNGVDARDIQGLSAPAPTIPVH